MRRPWLFLHYHSALAATFITIIYNQLWPFCGNSRWKCRYLPVFPQLQQARLKTCYKYNLDYIHTYVHVFHQQMNIQPILIGTTNWFGIWDHAKSNRHPEVWELQHSNDLYLWCLKSHMAVADLILNKIRVLCNCWSHLDSWLIQHNAFVSPSPGYNGSPSNWSQRAAPECGPTVIYFN